jgi:hypothetical protein
MFAYVRCAQTDFKKIKDARMRIEGAEWAMTEVGMSSYVGYLVSDSPEAQHQDNFPGVTELLQMMPNLKVLDLHLYYLLHGSIRENDYHKIFTRIAQTCAFPALEQGKLLR